MTSVYIMDLSVLLLHLSALTSRCMSTFDYHSCFAPLPRPHMASECSASTSPSQHFSHLQMHPNQCAARVGYDLGRQLIDKDHSSTWSTTSPATPSTLALLPASAAGYFQALYHTDDGLPKALHHMYQPTSWSFHPTTGFLHLHPPQLNAPHLSHLQD